MVCQVDDGCKLWLTATRHIMHWLRQRQNLCPSDVANFDLFLFFTLFNWEKLMWTDTRCDTRTYARTNAIIARSWVCARPTMGVQCSQCSNRRRKNCACFGATSFNGSRSNGSRTKLQRRKEFDDKRAESEEKIDLTAWWWTPTHNMLTTHSQFQCRVHAHIFMEWHAIGSGADKKTIRSKNFAYSCRSQKKAGGTKNK